MELREKVIKGIECCLPMTTRYGYADCKHCPYDRKITLEGGICECCHELMSDALELIKGQEAQRDYEAAAEMAEYCEHYEPAYNPEDGSM